MYSQSISHNDKNSGRAAANSTSKSGTVQKRSDGAQAVIQREVSTDLMVRDLVYIKKIGKLGQISSIYNPLSGHYFVTVVGGIPFAEGSGLYTPEELDYPPPRNFGNFGGNTLPNEISEKKSLPKKRTDTKRSKKYLEKRSKKAPSFNFEEEGSELKKLSQKDEKFDIPEPQKRKPEISTPSLIKLVSEEEDESAAPFNVGYEDGFAEGYDSFSEGYGGPTRYKNFDFRMFRNTEYETGYNEGYESGVKIAKIDASERVEEQEGDLNYLTDEEGEYDFPDEIEAADRKKRAKAYFEDLFKDDMVQSTEDIEKVLPLIKKHFQLRNISYNVMGDELVVAFYASPPDYTHLKKVKYGPDETEETDHDDDAFDETSSTLTNLDSDKNLKTPLKAIMDDLKLKEKEVYLLSKGDTKKVDRPKRVLATIAGARRTKGNRVGGEVVPATIAHLGHHENMVLNKNESSWISFYDGGHLIGDQLISSKGPDTFRAWNLAPMEQVLNQKSYLSFAENVILKGVESSSSKKVKKSKPISVIASVYYPDQSYKVKEKALAQSGFIPNDGTIPKTGNMPGKGGLPLSGKDRDVTIPSRVPYKWVLDAKVQKSTNAFVSVESKKSPKSKGGSTAFPYFNYSDLKTSEVTFEDRHWWNLTGAKKDAKIDKITTPSKQQQLHFEAYQYYPKR